MPPAHSSAHPQDEDLDIVAIWLRVDPIRWISGIFAGVFAGIVALAFAMFLAKLGGMDVLLPVKLGAIPFFGNEAMELGFVVQNVLVGFITMMFICAVLGFCYAHFTGVDATPMVLLGSGLTWGLFSWIFIFCLFIQSFEDIRTMELPKGPAFFVMLVFGLSLASVSFFQRIIRGR